MKHAMIDIETMGTNPGAVIISLAAVQFEPGVPESVGASFKMNFALQDSISYGFRIEADTLLWWLKQKPEILSKQLDETDLVSTVLGKFSSFLIFNKIEYVWGNSASFDCGLLAAYYRRLKLPVPFSHWNERCYRTLINLTPFKRLNKDEAQAHDPLYDCQYQIKNVHKFYEENLTYKPE